MPLPAPRKYWGDSDNWGPVWDTDPDMYPDPAGLVQTLHDMDVHFMVSVWAKFSNEDCLETLRASGDRLVDAENNTEHYMDAWDPSSQLTYFSLLNASMFSIGVDAIWLDGSTIPSHLCRFASVLTPSTPTSLPLDSLDLLDSLDSLYLLYSLDSLDSLNPIASDADGVTLRSPSPHCRRISELQVSLNSGPT